MRPNGVIPDFKHALAETVGSLLDPDLPTNSIGFAAAVLEGIEAAGWMVMVDQTWETDTERRQACRDALQRAFSREPRGTVGSLVKAAMKAMGAWTILPPVPPELEDQDSTHYVDSDVDLSVLRSVSNSIAAEGLNVDQYGDLLADRILAAPILRPPWVEPFRSALELALSESPHLACGTLQAAEELARRLPRMLKEGTEPDDRALVCELAQLIDIYRDFCPADMAAEVAGELIPKRGWRIAPPKAVACNE